MWLDRELLGQSIFGMAHEEDSFAVQPSRPEFRTWNGIAHMEGEIDPACLKVMENRCSSLRSENKFNAREPLSKEVDHRG